jgi:hypothetical protein
MSAGTFANHASILITGLIGIAAFAPEPRLAALPFVAVSLVFSLWADAFQLSPMRARLSWDWVLIFRLLSGAMLLAGIGLGASVEQFLRA